MIPISIETFQTDCSETAPLFKERYFMAAKSTTMNSIPLLYFVFPLHNCFCFVYSVELTITDGINVAHKQIDTFLKIKQMYNLIMTKHVKHIKT